MPKYLNELNNELIAAHQAASVALVVLNYSKPLRDDFTNEYDFIASEAVFNENYNHLLKVVNSLFDQMASMSSFIIRDRESGFMHDKMMGLD